MSKLEKGGIKYLYFKRIPRPRLDKEGGVVIEYREVPKDPYDFRIEERIKAGEPPPEEPPVELAQNE